MSLLASLVRASTQFQQAMEKRQQPASATDSMASAGVAQPESNPGTNATDDRFTWSGSDEEGLTRPKSSKLAMTEYKLTVGRDVAYVRDTLRHKLAEYSLPPATALNITKGSSGAIEVKGPLPEETRAQIETDLNINTGFREAFNRLSTNEPTLQFVDTAMKLNQAYGVNNPLLDTMVSENQQFNGLQDLAHRYDSLRRTASAEQLEAAGKARGYAFNLNTRA
ncbi:hypothetical protein FWJ25_17290 [Marinobacter salinexigens]|uniref:Uncharacterized protein n=1 Tax=Marinobacter salinexigens TaxID=2919747 RepID=A0A5B0VAS6_9GAMM|nr:hypothetical protein [Marinobacter salinexigens]KAA1171161.1 hypothetical protein FWJ25_17290 [Marinobacter salinexigens]